MKIKEEEEEEPNLGAEHFMNSTMNPDIAHSSSTSNDVDSLTIDEDDLQLLSSKNASKRKFPPSCPVWYSLSSSSKRLDAHQGIVTSVYTNLESGGFVYKVMKKKNDDVNVGNNGDATTITEREEEIFLPENQLCYAMNCPVTVKGMSIAGNEPGNKELSAKILCPRPGTEDRKFSYSVLLLLEGDKVRVELGVETKQITFRKVIGTRQQENMATEEKTEKVVVGKDCRKNMQDFNDSKSKLDKSTGELSTQTVSLGRALESKTEGMKRTADHSKHTTYKEVKNLPSNLQDMDMTKRKVMKRVHADSETKQTSSDGDHVRDIPNKKNSNARSSPNDKVTNTNEKQNGDMHHTTSSSHQQLTDEQPYTANISSSSAQSSSVRHQPVEIISQSQKKPEPPHSAPPKANQEKSPSLKSTPDRSVSSGGWVPPSSEPPIVGRHKPPILKSPTAMGASSMSGASPRQDFAPKFPDPRDLPKLYGGACRLTVPLWVTDASTQSLFHHIVGASERGLGFKTQEIEARTNCTVSISRLDRKNNIPIYITLLPKYGRFEMTLAREMVEDSILEFVEFEGQRARLIYELAVNLEGASHLGRSDGGIVQQRHYISHKGIFWMKLLDVPTLRNVEVIPFGKYVNHKVYPETQCSVRAFGEGIGTPPFALICGKISEQVVNAVKLAEAAIHEYQQRAQNDEVTGPHISPPLAERKRPVPSNAVERGSAERPTKSPRADENKDMWILTVPSWVMQKCTRNNELFFHLIGHRGSKVQAIRSETGCSVYVSEHNLNDTTLPTIKITSHGCAQANMLRAKHTIVCSILEFLGDQSLGSRLHHDLDMTAQGTSK